MSSQALPTARIPALSVAQAIVADGLIDYDTCMPQRRWDDLERTLTALREGAHDGEGQQNYVSAYHEFSAYTARSGHAALDQLRQWQADRPDSRFPALLEVAYWASWFERYRGSDTADQVTPAMWACAHTVQDALLCALIKLLARDPTAWPAIISVIYTVAAIGEPDWWQRWLRDDARPDKLPSHGRASDISEALAQSGAAVVPGQQHCRSLPNLLPQVLRGDALAWRRQQSNDGHAALEYWLRVAFAMDPLAVEVACTYISFRMPRWGGSWEEMLAFVDSPLCERFDENDRNVLRFFAWFDELEVDDSSQLEDPRVLKHHLRLGKQLLQRPLPQNLRGRVHKYLAYLEARNDRIDAACAHYVISAPLNHYQDWEIIRSVSTWCASGDKGIWLGQIAEVNRLEHAHGAALYGLLCQTGWAGVARNPEVAEGWFERAVKMTADPTDVALSPINAMASFADHFESEALLPMWLKAAGHGDASAQFCCGNYFELGTDRPQALKYFRLAADNNHEVAMYNVASLSLIPVRDGEITGAQAQTVATQALDYLDRALARTEQVLESSYSEFTEGQLDTVKDLYGTVLHSDWPPLSARRRVVPQLLKFAHEGRINAMISLAWWYGDKNLPDYQHLEAVRWIEAARHTDPDNEYLEGARALVEGDSFWSRLKFGFAQRKAKREGLPGQADTML